MQTLTKKTTILFSPDLYHQLKNIAEATKTSVAQLIRQAVIRQYLLSDKKKRMEAVAHLTKIGGPVSDWETIEQEIIKGHLNDI
ncbi:MAG: CopG family transcriptional regulator [Candidatus Omnitrophota bacterium]